jgi:gamma-glutamylcyclotransferase (GGCT)/AIG2-like uncharacterized protein YtfP
VGDEPNAGGNCDTIFVYGTLRSEFGNEYARRLHGEADFLGPATVRGSIFLVAAYPGYKREPDGVVCGELWRLRDPEKTLAALDDYEGPEYSRVLVSAVPIGTSQREPPAPHSVPQPEPPPPPQSAWIYRYEREVRADCRITSGDFRAR